MYKDFYHFIKEPFNITPDPEFLYLSPTHQEVLATIVYGIENRKAFILITGGVGVGKTSILRAYLRDIDRDKARYIYIINPNLTFRELLEKIFKELQIEAEGLTTAQMVDRLHRVLVDEYLHGRNFFILIDEAQSMPLETLEYMRLLSNLETSTDKLIQFVFAAPPEFEQILEHPQLRSLKQRIAVSAKILPLNAEESAEYIQYRLSLVAKSDEQVFTKDAIKMIAAKSKGIPRIINIICDNALVTGLGYHQKPVNARIVKEVIDDLKAAEKSKRKLNKYKWAPIAAGFVFLLVVGLLFTMFKAFSIIDDQRAQLNRFQRTTIRGKIDTVPREQAKPATDQIISATSGPANLPASGGEKTDKSAVHQISKDDPAAGDASKQTVPSISEDKPDKPSSAEKQTEEIVGINQMNDPNGIIKPAKSSRREKEYPIKTIVKKDDTLFRLTIRAYGFSNEKVLMLVKKNNPSIKDIRYIEAGSTIIFPPLDESLKESNDG